MSHFFYLAYSLLHAALQLSRFDTIFKAYKKKFGEVPKAVPPTWDGVRYQPQAYPLSAYAAMVTKRDGYVGEVLATRKRLGIEKNTRVVFASDNGPHRKLFHGPAILSVASTFSKPHIIAPEGAS